MADEMKKNIDNEEIELDALEEVSGGATIRDPGIFWEARVTFTEEDIKRLERLKGWPRSAEIIPNKEYTRSDVNELLGFRARDKDRLVSYLKQMGLDVY